MSLWRPQPLCIVCVLFLSAVLLLLILMFGFILFFLVCFIFVDKLYAISVSTTHPRAPSTFLSRIDAGSRVVVGDVSMSHQKALRGEIPAKTFHHWMAPEAIREKKFTEKSDVVGQATFIRAGLVQSWACQGIGRFWF